VFLEDGLEDVTNHKMLVGKGSKASHIVVTIA
jgi:hypothetical protein